MKFKAIFEMDVNRLIETVLNASDEASLKSNLEKYVLTNEKVPMLKQAI